MNCVVKRYSVGKSLLERQKLQRLWQTLESDHTPLGRSPLLSFGRTAVAFMRKLQEQSGRASEKKPAPLPSNFPKRRKRTK